MFLDAAHNGFLVAPGDLRADTDADDVRALAAAIAWVSGQLPPDPDRRTRLLQMVLDGIRAR
jgi:hypothetical protein